MRPGGAEAGFFGGIWLAGGKQAGGRRAERGAGGSRAGGSQAGWPVSRKSAGSWAMPGFVRVHTPRGPRGERLSSDCFPV